MHTRTKFAVAAARPLALRLGTGSLDNCNVGNYYQGDTVLIVVEHDGKLMATFCDENERVKNLVLPLPNCTVRGKPGTYPITITAAELTIEKNSVKDVFDALLSLETANMAEVCLHSSEFPEHLVPLGTPQLNNKYQPEFSEKHIDILNEINSDEVWAIQNDNGLIDGFSIHYPNTERFGITKKISYMNLHGEKKEVAGQHVEVVDLPFGSMRLVIKLRYGEIINYVPDKVSKI